MCLLSSLGLTGAGELCVITEKPKNVGRFKALGQDSLLGRETPVLIPHNFCLLIKIRDQSPYKWEFETKTQNTCQQKNH